MSSGNSHSVLQVRRTVPRKSTNHNVTIKIYDTQTGFAAKLLEYTVYISCYNNVVHNF
jgi:hypothetical protein